jgi:hypothetical protein
MEYHRELVCFTNEYNSLMKALNQLEAYKARSMKAMTQKEQEANLLMLDAVNEKITILLENITIHAETLKRKITQ